MKSILVFLFLLQAIILNLVSRSRSEPLNSDIFRCRKDTGNFPSKGGYQQDLSKALKRLDDVVKLSYFKFNYYGNTLGGLLAAATCPAYIKAKACASCVNSTIPQLVQKCPQQKQALAWTRKCMVQYAPNATELYNMNWFIAHEASENKTKEVLGLKNALAKLADNDNLVYEAAMNTDGGRYAYGNEAYGLGLVVHMVMQCAHHDSLPSGDCRTCLLLVIGEMKSCCSRAIAAAVFNPRCFVRYAHTDFRTS
ncbi:hypothetical protein QVD17_17911 [Tagetes erecta]|uniref:Gnk2-homologous domain-containing protein n=1 Tax=Tagetes erecta TaxID=13708 RepID=A0AAD8NNG8_TARER|nr:hypothetical protein QVD17_17911 [Tagetes erecta]